MVIILLLSVAGAKVRQLCHITAGPCIRGAQPGVWDEGFGWGEEGL